MKKKIQLLITMLVVLAAVACKKDKENINSSTPSTKNAFNFDGKDYDLSTGIKTYYGVLDSNEAQGHNFDLTFLSSGFTIVESDGSIDSVKGKGNFLYFELFTDNATDLKNGTYILDTVNVRPGTFDIGEVLFNYSFNEENVDEIHSLVSGSLNYANNNGTQTITFTGKTSDNKTLSGSFKGMLKTYDESNQNLRSKPVKIHKSVK